MRIPLGFNRCIFLEVRRRCRHEVLGLCPRCYPLEARTLKNKKLALALAWLERLGKDDPHISDLRQLRRMAIDALEQVADVQL